MAVDFDPGPIIISGMKGTPITIIAGIVCLAILAVPATARTWKSADGSKSFEAEFVKLEGDKLTVRNASGKTMTFKLGILSAKDRAFAKAEAARIAKAGTQSAVFEDLDNAVIPKALRGKLMKLEGGRLRDYNLSTFKTPRYYILYYSAST